MQFQTINETGFIRLDRGEDLFGSLLNFAKTNNFQAGRFSGIGALCEIEMGFYELHRKQYIRKKFNEIHELVSMTGNLSLKDGNPFLHIHAAIGDSEFRIFGGHLFSATVAVTCEITFDKFSANLTRLMNDNVGLALWSFCP